MEYLTVKYNIGGRGERGVPLPRSEILWVPGSRVEGKWAGERKKIAEKKSQKRKIANKKLRGG